MRIFLRMRMLSGVASTSSVSSMNSRACSRVMMCGGVRSMASSLALERMLLMALALQGLTTKSLSVSARPTTMPS